MPTIIACYKWVWTKGYQKSIPHFGPGYQRAKSKISITMQPIEEGVKPNKAGEVACTFGNTNQAIVQSAYTAANYGSTMLWDTAMLYSQRTVAA